MKKIINKIVLIFLFNAINLVSLGYAQVNNPKFQHLTIEHGLSQNTVTSIKQDKKGFLWFGTHDGVNKYDGYSFKVYRFNPEQKNCLSDNTVNTIFIDHSGQLWVGTGNGLNKYNSEKEMFSHYFNDPNNPNSLSGNEIQSIYEDHNHVLWFGTNNGLNKLVHSDNEGSSLIFKRYLNHPDGTTSLSHNYIQSIAEDNSNSLWIGANNGLNKLIPDQNEGVPQRFIRYQNDPKNRYSISSNEITVICKDHYGNLWIGTKNGLNRLYPLKNNKKVEKFIRYKNIPNNPSSLSDNYIMTIYEDKSATIWIGTNRAGINKYDRLTDTFDRYQHDPLYPYSLSENEIRSIYQDRSGVLWIGNYISGVNKFYIDKKKFFHFKNNPLIHNSLSNNTVFAVFEDKSGIIWLGTWGGGLNRFDRKNNLFSFYQHDPDNINSLSSVNVRSIYMDNLGILWIGTDNGLDRFNLTNNKFKHYKYNPDNPTSISNNYVRVIYEDSYGIFWIATDNGLNQFDRNTEKFTRYINNPEDPHSIGSNRVYAIHEDSLGILWIGTFGGGLNRFDRKTHKFIRYKNNRDNPNSLSQDNVLFIHEDKSGIMWLGTDGGGLNKLVLSDHEGSPLKFTHYSTNHGLPSTTIYCILEDSQGELWMSHNKGISRFNPHTENFKNYNDQDGLQSNEFNGGSGCKSKTGELLFGGINGFNIFYPDSIKDNPYVPPIVITDFKIFNKSVAINEQSVLKKSIIETNYLELSYTDLVFSFEFAALDFSNPEKNKYAYIMEGFEKNWNYTNNRRFITYTNLQPGEYIFRVKGSNNDGIWNEEGTSLKITISPPFWQIWWFKLISSLLVVLLIFTVHRVRVKNIRERNKILKEVNIKLNEQVSKRKRLERKAERRAAQSALIYKVGQRVSGELKLDALLSETVTAISETFNYDAVMLLLVNTDGDYLIFRSVAGAYSTIFKEGMTFPISEGIAGYAAKTGKTQLSNDVSSNPHYVQEADEDTKSELAIPIKSGEEIIGVLDIESKILNAFDNTDVEAMETLSAQIASAIENANLYEKAQQEIEDRLNAEQALRQSEESFRSLAENAFDGIIISTGDGDYIYANRRAAEITGYSIEQLLKLKLKDLFPRREVKKVMNMLTHISKEESIREIHESTLIKNDGNEVSIEIAATKTSWHGKTADMFFFRDITDRQRVEEEIQKMQKLESIGILAGGIAHDFNNRISIILGNAQIAKIVSGQGGDISRYLQNIEEGTEQAKALTQQLLTFSMGGAPIKKVASIEETLKKSTRFSLSGSNVKCNFVIPENIWPVEVDVGQIDQVIGNIVINANQAMPEGGMIHISAENLDILSDDKIPLTKGRYVKIIIMDSGIGIQQKHLKKIFDPYFTTKSKGSGLGLTIAYSVIKNHGGLLTVESTIGSGTTFYIYIPASDKKIPKEEVQDYRPGIGKGKVLVMDDEELVREMAGDMLKSLGYEAGFAKDGFEAIEEYKQALGSGNPYLAILMDLTIPGSMGGKEAIRKLKKIDPNVKVIVSSGYSNDPIMSDYKKHGFEGVIAKPYKIKEFDEALINILRKDLK